ncbi:hypothetical protein D3P96_03850 [Weissella viridescens]|uniref:Uncharacterized protein n=1 Tax=Weissella viridescens TaxID=1629 RepID=A0A3P2RBE1_WEIVI|nr:hypothetical protein [Weissella viridescens]RRG18069.1 hypothetical protein D3P96_03850 [Weissella viridescens]
MASEQVVDVEKLNDWDLTNDELNVLDILYWVAMYPDEKEGKSISMQEMFQKAPFENRMAKVIPNIASEIGDTNLPTCLYRYARLRYDKTSSINPIVSILNHLGDAGYLELDEAKMRTNKVDTLIEKIVTGEKKKRKYNFSKASFNDQANVYIMIRRKGIIPAEKSNREKVYQNFQRQEQEIQIQEQKEAKAQAESSKNLEKIVAYFGGLSVLVAIADWDWTADGMLGHLFKLVVVLLTLILIYQYVSKKQKKDQ